MKYAVHGTMKGVCSEAVAFFFQSKAVRMTILGRLTTLTHLDDVMVAEEEAAYAIQMAAGSKINQVEILQISLVAVFCQC